MSTPPSVAFRPTYVGWLIAFLIIATCFFGILGVVPVSDKLTFGLIGALALAIFFR